MAMVVRRDDGGSLDQGSNSSDRQSETWSDWRYPEHKNSAISWLSRCRVWEKGGDWVLLTSPFGLSNWKDSLLFHGVEKSGVQGGESGVRCCMSTSLCLVNIQGKRLHRQLNVWVWTSDAGFHLQLCCPVGQPLSTHSYLSLDLS